MENSSQWIIAAAMMASMTLVGCGNVGSEAEGMAAATVEKTDGGINRITLLASSSKRLGIQFVELTSNGGMLEAPYDVVLYDNFGKEFVYTSPKPNVFRRTPIKVDRVEGDTVYISEGPATGTKVVTYGAAMLLGIEAGVGQ